MSAFEKSGAWHDRRVKGIGGSEVASILGLSPYKSVYQLWQEKTKRITPPDLSGLPHIIRGHLGEEACRMKLETERLKAYRPRTWNGKKAWHLCSDDGYNVDDNSLLEIKCMGRDNHEKAGKGIIPPHYECQVQWNLFVSGAAFAEFISYRPEDETMHIIQVAHDLVRQAEIEAAVDNFWLNHVMKDEAPEMSDLDFIEVKDEQMDALLQDFGRSLIEYKRLEGHLDSLKERLRPFVATHPMVKSREGFKLTKTKSDQFRIKLPELWVTGE